MNTLRWILAVAVLALAGYLVGSSGAPVQAASDPVPECKAVATTPNLSIYLCEPDNGPPFYINSYGFMTLLE